MSATFPRGDYGLRYHKRMLYIFGSLSVLGNVAYGFVSGTGTLPALATAAVASVFPLTLMAASDDLVVLARHCTGAVRASMMAMAAATAVLMFIVSFDALSGLFVMAGKGDLVAKCGAVAIDLMVVQASISALWASNKVREAEVVTEAAAAVDEAAEAARVAEEQAATQAAAQAELEAQRATERAAQAVQYDAEAQVLAPAEAVAQPAIERSDTELSTGVELLNLSSGLDDVADEHAPAQPVEQGAQNEVAQPVEQGAQNEVAQPEQSSEATELIAQSGDVQPSDLGLNGIEQEDREWLSTLLSGLDEGAQCADEGVEQVDWIETEQPGLSAQLSGVEQPVERATEQPGAQPEHATEHPAQTDVRSLAERAHPELNPKVSVEVLAELIEASRAGASQRRLGDMAGVSPNTAARYVQAAERLGSHPEAA